MIIQKLIEYIIFMIFWPTTKMALAVPDLSKFDWVHFWLDSLMVQPTTKLASGLSDLSKLIEYIICKIFWPTTKMALAVPEFSKLIEYIIIMIFWPTTKMALAVPDSSKFDWVHFLARFFDGLTYDKIGLWSFWFFKIDRVHYNYDLLTYDKNGPCRSRFFKIWLSTFFG